MLIIVYGEVNILIIVADQQSATLPTQVSSTRPRAGNNSTTITTAFVSAGTSSFQDLTSGLSYCYTLVGNVPEPSLSRE